MAHGRTTEACDMIRKAARTNRHESAEVHLDKLELERLEMTEVAPVSNNNNYSQELWELLKTKVLVFRLINCCICWWATTSTFT